MGVKFELFTVEEFSPFRMPAVISFSHGRLIFTVSNVCKKVCGAIGKISLPIFQYQICHLIMRYLLSQEQGNGK